MHDGFWKVRLTKVAQQDYEEILNRALDHFGVNQVNVYASPPSRTPPLNVTQEVLRVLDEVLSLNGRHDPDRQPDRGADPPSGFLSAGRHGAGRAALVPRHAAQGAALGSVLYGHPFAEEMNKSRRMAGLQARALARAGYDVLQIDLRGCGGSSGDFGDAS